MPSGGLGQRSWGLGSRQAAGLIDFRRHRVDAEVSGNLFDRDGCSTITVTRTTSSPNSWGNAQAQLHRFYIVARYGVVFHVRNVMSAHPWRLVT